MLPSSDTSPTTIRKLRVDLVTWTPCCCTTWGRRGVASWSLFWTWTWAMLGSMSASKVRVMDAMPAESLVDVMYFSWSMPFIFCSMTWVTVFSMVWAEAPG